jgi:spore photoproduct lyase
MTTLFKPQKIIIEKSVLNCDLTRRVTSRIDAEKMIIDDAESFIKNRGQPMEPVQAKSILLARQRGPFMRFCPGTPRHICCLYRNLDVVEGCDLNCSYCILQCYLHSPYITLYCNTDDMFNELDDAFTKRPDEFFRVGSGELSDSLTFDYYTELSVDLVTFFAPYRNAIIELKSKNVHVDKILSLSHRRRSVVSWSLNSEFIHRTEERETPDIPSRIEAAKKVQQAGYWLGFHFDPLIYYENWEKEYKNVIDALFAAIDPQNIAWISLGALRYPPELDRAIRRNHPDSKIVLGELLPGIDKKYRYFRQIRIDMFRTLYRHIRQYSGDVFVYLCMESDEVWNKAFGWSPGNSATLKKLLDQRVMLSE